MTKKQAAQMVAMLAAAYPYAKVNVDTSEVYESLLSDLDFEVTKQAIARLITTKTFMPTIAEIRESATSLRLGPPRTGGEAWADACAMVRNVGRYGTPKWSDPILAETMRLWGAWRDFCNSPEDDPGGRARFIEMYDQLAARARADVVSGIALPAAGGPLRLVESNEQKSKAVGARGRLTGVVGGVDGHPGSGGSRGAGHAADLIDQVVSATAPGAAGHGRTGQAPWNALVRPESKFAGRKLTADEIEAEMGVGK